MSEETRDIEDTYASLHPDVLAVSPGLQMRLRHEFRQWHWEHDAEIIANALRGSAYAMLESAKEINLSKEYVLGLHVAAESQLALADHIESGGIPNSHTLPCMAYVFRQAESN